MALCQKNKHKPLPIVTENVYSNDNAYIGLKVMNENIYEQIEQETEHNSEGSIYTDTAVASIPTTHIDTAAQKTNNRVKSVIALIVVLIIIICILLSIIIQQNLEQEKGATGILILHL